MKLSAKSILAIMLVLLSVAIAISTATSAKEKTVMINKSTPILHVKAVEPSIKFWTERFGCGERAGRPLRHLFRTAKTTGGVILRSEDMQSETRQLRDLVSIGPAMLN